MTSWVLCFTCISRFLPKYEPRVYYNSGKCKELATELANPDLKASSRRNNLAQLRELKQVIRRHDKFMNTVSRLQSSIELVIKACPDIREVILVLGGSILRPLCSYSLCFLHGNVVSRGENDFAKSKAADALSRKAIQSADLPECRFRFLSRLHHKRDNGALIASQTGSSNCLNKDAPNVSNCLNRDLSKDSDGLNKDVSEELIWFLCQHVMKGLASRSPTSEE